MKGIAQRLLSGSRVLAAVAGVGLGLFHLRLFVDDLVGGQLADPGLVVRWVIAGAVVAVLFVLGRSGASLIGTRGIAVWLLVAMLHGPVISQPDSHAAPVPAEVFATLLQTVAAVAGVVLLLATGFAQRGWHATLAYLPGSVADGVRPRPSSAFVHFLAPRPPPRIR